MSWYANADRRRAFRVVRRVKSRDAVVLVNAYGLEFEEPEIRLEQSGYHEVKAKPRYAG